MVLFVEEWWASLSNAEHVFWVIAMIFTVLFIIQFVLSIVGMDLESDADADIDGDIDADYDVDPSFTLFSVRSIIAFFTFFGWTGVLVLKSGASVTLAVIASFISGTIAMSFVAYILFQLMKLSESGTVDLHGALRSIGEVYLTIPASKKGKGKIHVKISGKVMELDAMTEGEDIPNGEHVQVVELLEDNVMLVETYKE